jgi:hypothetical protein
MGWACGEQKAVSSNILKSRNVSRFTSLCLKIGLASFSISIVVLCFELGLRILGYEAIYEIYSKSSTLWRADPELGWHHEPNSNDVFVGPRPWPVEFETSVRINSLGLRGPEVSPRSEDDIRLLFLGDSMVVAMEVEYGKTFPARIAEELSVRTGKLVRSINAGVRGYGTDQSLLYFRDQGRLLEPDIVIFFHSGNDPRNNRTLHRMRRPMGKAAFVLREDGSLELIGSPVPDYPICSAYSVGSQGQIQRLDGVFTRMLCRAQMVLFDRSALFSFITLRIDWNPGLLGGLYRFAVPKVSSLAKTERGREPAREITMALLNEINHEVEHIGARLILTGEDSQLARDLDLDEIRSMGVVVSPLLMDNEEEPPTRFLRDAHYTERGHERVVEQLIPGLDELIRQSGLVAERP